MWAAALTSLVFSLISIGSLGLVTLLLTCLQLAAAIALRRSAAAHGWTFAVAVLVWVVIVPAQLLGAIQADWFYAPTLAFLLGSLVLMVPVRYGFP
jgi:drug/metabolite transporter superfamily protein YnfA